MKKIVSVILLVCMSLFLIPITVFATEDVAAVAEEWNGKWPGEGDFIGVGINNGSTHLKLELPSDGRYAYGVLTSENTTQVETDSDTLPSDGWNWAIQNTGGSNKLILNNASILVSDYDAIMFDTSISIELRGTNNINVSGGSAISGNKSDVTIEGNGLLIIPTSVRAITVNFGNVTINSGTYKLTSTSQGIFATKMAFNGGDLEVESTNGIGAIDVETHIGGGSIKAKSGISQPFTKEPILTNGISHNPDSAPWNNTGGKMCEYGKFEEIKPTPTPKPTSQPSVTYTITPKAGIGGTISSTDVISVKAGDSVGYSFAANKGYRIDKVLVNGTNVGNVSEYVFTNVQGNQTLEVTFVKVVTTATVNNKKEDVKATPTPSATPEATMTPTPSSTPSATPEESVVVENNETTGFPLPVIIGGVAVIILGLIILVVKKVKK